MLIKEQKPVSDIAQLLKSSEGILKKQRMFQVSKLRRFSMYDNTLGSSLEIPVRDVHSCFGSLRLGD